MHTGCAKYVDRTSKRSGHGWDKNGESPVAKFFDNERWYQSVFNLSKGWSP